MVTTALPWGALALASAGATAVLHAVARRPARVTEAEILTLLGDLSAAGGQLAEGDERLAGKARVVAAAARRGLVSDGSGWAAHLALTDDGRATLHGDGRLADPGV